MMCRSCKSCFGWYFWAGLLGMWGVAGIFEIGRWVEDMPRMDFLYNREVEDDI